MPCLLKLLASAMLAVTASLALAAGQPASIRIGSPDQSAGNKPFIAGPLGLAHIHQQLEQAFAADGVKIEWHFFKGAGPAVNEAFANRQLDIAYLGDLAAIIGRASGLETRVLLGSRGANMYLAATPESSIEGLEDLKGKRISVYRGTADQLSFARVLASAGLKERDLRIVSLDWSAARAALAARQIDAAWSGMGILALEAQGIEFPFGTKQLPVTSTTQGALLASADFIQRYPQATQKLVDILVGNAAWISDARNQDEYIDLLASQSSIPAALFTREFQGDDLVLRNSPRLDDFLRASFQDSGEQARALGLTRRPVEIDAWFEPSFVENAIVRQGLQLLWPRYDHDGEPATD
ncbi:ABC transporter substrate-binding protein [Stutzerimonas kirkiae]|uniref:Alkanesulfonate-binding protein n=1 Tax=Stutzerimonas kirkiae TaxID=2211392 RepID=A0A4Q9RDB9_9GAMM|nr:ABC transporter substrate-binding protein [Stutzerimonas kirkiae]TBU98134.1 alkanesulfonate-binding protein [Stutzerimonas kirkiae]TBV02351.1 alkanesulfonate-binding protein [Stutzerimonas kirkiae]TBV11186.1 alkanesulfonate-binding protein [Stutzerimonas kirkiae]